MNWAYGVTTVPDRLKDLFPRTLASLALAGFDSPRLFVDNCEQPNLYDRFNLPLTTRWPRIRTYGNWILALAELYIRDPKADRYALFQDDFVTVKGLRAYLDRSPYPANGYLNLYTFPANQSLAPPNRSGWYVSNQAGYGAVALVFSLEAVTTLLAQQSIVDRPQDAKKGHRSIDGGIVDAFSKVGWKEYVHNPSLVQHTGILSSMGNRRHPLAQSFPGENFDATTLLGAAAPILQGEWEVELDSLNRAMAEDQARLKASKTPADVNKYTRLVLNYRKRINQHLRKRT